MKKKIVFVSIISLLLISVFLFNSSASKKEVYIDKDYIKENNNKSIAIYLEDDNGNYNKTTSFPTKGSNYVLNTNKSVCDGSANISWDNDKYGIELTNIDRENTKCYLYFMKATPLSEVVANIRTQAKTEAPDFSQVATTDEGIYAIEDGMYGGTSYYWRGAATTNYVKFAGFCWRAIRVNGNGSLRLIYDGSTCHANGESTTDSIAVSNVAYSINSNQSNYVGWTYEGQLQRPTSNGTASNAKMQLESWYSSNITGTNASNVAQGKYCNDRNNAWSGTWTINGSAFYYAGYKRIDTDHSPSLECPSDDVYTLSVGLITADEAMYAGGTNKNQISYYLYNGQNYWTMSPAGWYSSSIGGVFYVSDSGYLRSNLVSDTTRGLRPVINLKSDTQFQIGGNGTLDNPYIVI